MNNQSLINVPNPINIGDAANKYYVDSVSTKLTGNFLNNQLLIGFNNGTSIGGYSTLTFLSSSNTLLLGNSSTLSNLIVNSVNITPSPGDLIYEKTFYPNNGQLTSAFITGFEFDTSVVRSFASDISVYIALSGGSLVSKYKFNCEQSTSGWKMYLDRHGDYTGFQFTIDSNGKVLYKNTLISNYVSSVLKFRATTTSI